jgi:hypothetical protein
VASQVPIVVDPVASLHCADAVQIANDAVNVTPHAFPALAGWTCAQTLVSVLQ